jgi:hypothetical protein
LGAVGALALGASGYLAYRADSDEGLALEVGRLPIDHASGRTHLENEAGDFRAAEWATLAGGGALVITGVLVGLFAGTHTETVQVAAMPTPGGASLLVGGSL